MQVEAVINQAESGDFRIGQRATVKLDAFPGIEFPGEVFSIGALAVGGFRQSQYIRTVPLRIMIEGNHPKLIPDLSASADVVIQSADNQVLVPLGAVREENGNRVVYVKTAQGFEARAVEVGLQSDLQAAITSGIKAGEVVRVN
jgi:hypothetical protein